MKERPILFSALMVNAILAGRKTQTRRLINFIVPESRLDLIEIVDPSGNVSYRRPAGDPMIEEAKRFKYTTRTVLEGLMLRSPFKVGDRLWVRETLKKDPDMNCWKYAADGQKVPFPLGETAQKWAETKRQNHCVSIHMPRWASRILLEITSIRVELLHDISIGAVISEGVMSLPEQQIHAYFPAYAEEYREWQKALEAYIAKHGNWKPGGPPMPKPPVGPGPLERFQALWESINGKDNWASNPFVWVVEFKRVSP